MFPAPMVTQWAGMRTYLIQEVSFPGRIMSHSSWVESLLSNSIWGGGRAPPWMDYSKGHSEKQHCQDCWGDTSTQNLLGCHSTKITWSPLLFPSR